jgi:hypothetical protein
MSYEVQRNSHTGMWKREELGRYENVRRQQDT